MPEEKRHDPFQQHIESDAFDVSGLGRGLSLSTVLEQEIREFLNTLPQPLDYELWDNALDEQRKLLCVHLTAELVERVIRPNHNDHVEHLTDDELIYILMVPVTVAMLAERHFNPSPAPAPKPAPDTTPTLRERLQRQQLPKRLRAATYALRERMSKMIFRLLERRQRY